jgi:transglutaminase-like putative cysteine protease
MLKNRGWVEGDFIRYSNLMTEKGSYIRVNMKLAAIKKEISGGKSKNLYKIIRTIENIPGIQSITWVDSNLIPQRGELIFPHMKYTLQPTSKEDALQVMNETLVSLDLARLQLNNFHSLGKGEYISKIKKVILLLKLKKGESFGHDLDGGLQHIRDGNLNDGLRLVIDTHIPKELKNIPICSPPEALAPFLSANSYIESDESKIIVLANQLMVKRSAWETALKIKNWVYANIMMTFDTGFTSALEVLNSGKGDCTEHAVLTAALCRACGIPARVTFGYNLSFRPDENPLYVGHMWNEVFIGGKWIPIDSTSPGTLLDPFRIRFFSSSLESRGIMKTTALFILTQNLDITLLSTTPSIQKCETGGSSEGVKKVPVQKITGGH